MHRQDHLRTALWYPQYAEWVCASSMTHSMIRSVEPVEGIAQIPTVQCRKKSSQPGPGRFVGARNRLS